MPDNQTEKIITRFKLIRDSLRLSQVELAELAKIKQSQVSAIESGKRNITPEIKLKLEDNLNINRHWLETGEGEMFKTNVVAEPNVHYGKSEDNTVLIGRV